MDTLERFQIPHPEYTKLLREHLDELNWCLLSENPAAIDIIRENKDRVKQYPNLASNPAAMDVILELYPYLTHGMPRRIMNYAINDILIVIFSTQAYINDHVQELANRRLIWKYLSCNPSAIDILKSRPGRIHWGFLSSNPAAIDILTMNKHRVNWKGIGYNSNAQELIKDNIELVDDLYLTRNSYAIDILKQYPEKIDWKTIKFNKNAFNLIMTHRKDILKTYVDISSYTDERLNEIINNNTDYIILFHVLSGMPDAIYLLQQHIDMIDWVVLSLNPAAIYMLKENQDKIDWNIFSTNRCFSYDYKAIMQSKMYLHEELTAYFYQPRFIQKWIMDGHDIDEYLS